MPICVNRRPRCLILIQQYTMIRAIKRERRYLNIKTLTALTLYLVSAAHHPRRRVEWRAARIFKAFSRLEDRLFPTTPGPLTSINSPRSFVIIQCRFSSCTVSRP